METVDSLKSRVESTGNGRGLLLAHSIALLIETCENVPKRRQNVKNLRKQCVSLLKLLSEGLSREPPTSDVLDPVFLGVNNIVWTANNRMRNWTKVPKWKIFLHTNSLDGDVASSLLDINRATGNLQSIFPSLGHVATCPNCKSRPVAPDPKAGTYFNYCSRACAIKARGSNPSQTGRGTHSVCKQCKQRPKFRKGNIVHPYCGMKCAKLAACNYSTLANPQPSSDALLDPQPIHPGTTCRSPACTLPVFIRPDGTPSDYCTVTHEEWGERGCISCRAAPMSSPSILCRACHNDALGRAPAIIEVPQDHQNYKCVESQFRKTWRHKTTCPEVKAIYKIITTEANLRQYQQYLDSVESRGNFVAMGKARGNEHRRWHGTKRRCNLGDPGITTFCAGARCSLCCVIKSSFDLKFFKASTGWGRFGHGIYVSSTSSKANDYSKNLGINSEWKALLLNKVIVGHGKKLTQDSASLTGPPPGYDSILGEVGGVLNYDELVVYHNDAVRPSYLVMYKSP